MRYHYLDNLRALAMMAGVLFHAALAYSPIAQAFFPTADRQTSTIVDLVIWFFHLFRMPLFFVVAGFFAAYLLMRHGIGGLFANRFRRIVLPFVVAWPLVFFSLTYATLYAAEHVQHPSPALVFIQQWASRADAPMVPPSTTHLWFLYYLMIFYVLIWCGVQFQIQRFAKTLRHLATPIMLTVLPLTLAPCLATVSAPHPAPESFLPNFWALTFFGAFFIYGLLLFQRDSVLLRWQWWSPLLLLASVALYPFFLNGLPDTPSWTATASWPVAIIEACISVWMTIFCLQLARKVLDWQNVALRYLARVSYWVYISHLPVLLVIQYYLMDNNWFWFNKWLVAVLATLMVCLLSYHIYGIIRSWRASARAITTA